MNEKIVIGVGALNDNTKQLYHDVLESIIDGKYTVVSFNFNKLNKKKVDVDILLISTPIMINLVKKHIKPTTKLITITRTFTKKSFELISAVPNAEKMYLVNNGIDVTFETISLIYTLGFDFELYPFYPGVEPIDEIKTAITTNEINLVPDTIEKIYNIGHMVYDISTILKLLNELNLDEDEKKLMIQNYQKKIINVDQGVNSLIDNNYFIQQEKNTIANLINEGLIETDNFGNILFVNEMTKSILKENNLVGKNVNEISEKIGIYLDENQYITDELIKYKKEQLIISTKPIYVLSEKVGNIIIIRNITEIKRLEDKLKKSISLSGHVAKYTLEDIIGTSREIDETKKLAKKMAKTNASVLITGESGTGKELFANAIHNESERSKFPFLAINCATLPESLIESELFGYEKGAFTGASKEGKLGLFEQAHHGTLFLDEIAELSIKMQSRLLRVLQESEIIRIGSSKIRTVDVRVISATNSDLYAESSKGKFRWDLYYRLNIFPIKVPSLRERKEDIPFLFEYFLKELKCNKPVNKEIYDIFYKYSWPGNVRELRNIVEYLAYMSEEEIKSENLPHNFNKVDNFKNSNEDKKLSKVKMIILNILFEKLKNKEKIGRKKLSSTLETKGVFLSEKEVRKELLELQNKELVTIGKGRQGTKITKKGIEEI
ncbi:MAG: sigma-54 interaction domain-containing protein [Eubacteriales bacterium]|jgi:transcriptional regulator with PAS, ATPase and Fis domain